MGTFWLLPAKASFCVFSCFNLFSSSSSFSTYWSISVDDPPLPTKSVNISRRFQKGREREESESENKESESERVKERESERVKERESERRYQKTY